MGRKSHLQRIVQAIKFNHTNNDKFAKLNLPKKIKRIKFPGILIYSVLVRRLGWMLINTQEEFVICLILQFRGVKMKKKSETIDTRILLESGTHWGIWRWQWYQWQMTQSEQSPRTRKKNWKNQNHTNHGIVVIGYNTKKNPGNLWKCSVSRNPLKD